MRFFNQDIPDGERDDHIDQTPEVSSSQIDMTRRGFVAALLATALLAGCNKQTDTGTIPPPPEVDTPESFAEKYDINTLRKMLIQKYPELGDIKMKTIKDKDGNDKIEEIIDAKFRKLAMKDEYQDEILVQAYFLKVTYKDLMDDGLIQKNDDVEADDYLHPENIIWPKKLKKVHPNHKKDMEVALANLIAEDRKNPPEKMDYQKFVDLAGKVVKDVNDKMGTSKAEAQVKFDEAKKNYDADSNDDTKLQLDIAKNRVRKYDLMNDYTSLIDSDFLVGLSIHEVMPVDYNDLMRIALLRTLFEEGFEINKIPAYYDNVASFGPMQMSVIPYEGRNRDNPFDAETEMRKVDGIIVDKKGREKKGKVLKEFDLIGDIEPYLEEFGLPHQLCDCIKLEDQLKAGMLLLLTNFRSLFKTLLSENARFVEIWNNSSLLERRTFLATILGTAHNNPKNAKLSLDQAIGWNRSQEDSADYFLDDDKNTKEVITNLTELRTAYLNIAKRCHEVSAREGLKTSDLVARFSQYNVDSEETTVQVTQIASVPKPDTSATDTTVPVKPPDTTDTSEPIKKPVEQPVEKPVVVTEKRHELKMLKREREGASYFTFDVPNWNLDEVAKFLCGNSKDGTIEAIKKLNKVKSFKPGDPILIPIQFMKKELQDPALVEVKIPKGKDKETYLRGILKDGVDPHLIVLYNPTKPPAANLGNLGDVLRIPKSLIK